MGSSLQLDTLSWEVHNNFIMNKFLAVLFFAVAAQAAPAADADADPQLLAAAPYAAPVVATAPNCKVENEVLSTKSCVPAAENVCTKEIVDTEEIEYEKVCKDVVDTICDAPAVAAPLAAHIVKREADADADAQVLAYGGLAAPYAAAVAPVAHAVAHSAITTVNKVACSDVENVIPKTTCEPVETTHVSGYAFP